jgi:Domain of unknown function (DUF4821)
VQTIAYFLPDTLILFPPFSSPRILKEQHSVRESKGVRRLMHKNSGTFFTEVPLINDKLSCSLQVCRRKQFLPLFQIRKARVEDCDDLVPLFKAHGVIVSLI